MKSFRIFAANAAKAFRLQVAFVLALAALFSPYDVSAQQPAVGRKRVPRLTTDDVTRPATSQPADQPAGQPLAKAEDGDKPGAGKPQAGSDKVSAEEAAWRDRVKAARERAKALERAAEEAELRVTELRNDLGTSGQSARDRNATAAELETLGQRLLELHAQARAAAEEVSQLLEHGRQKGFTESQEPKAASENGTPNEQYYRQTYARLSEALQTAERRIQLYENRVRDANNHIRLSGNKKGADSFYVLQIQQERDKAQESLDEARAALTKAQNELDALLEEARRAGLPPGTFR
jgi:hypothetical protein